MEAEDEVRENIGVHLASKSLIEKLETLIWTMITIRIIQSRMTTTRS